ncbi:MAG TPA: DUF2844 domain-containing protein [Steroidobacteraceae bacterium]|jgi:hypothetical protein
MPTLRSTGIVKKCVLAAGLLTAGLGPCIAVAALGEPEGSVKSDVAQMRGSIKVTANANYRSHEIQTPAGTVVREFSGANGNVFAILWSGPVMPNLRQTLGQYFDDYVAAAKANRAGHHHLDIHRTDLVVHASGHMRAFSGIAYLPQAVPSGVSVGELQ